MINSKFSEPPLSIDQLARQFKDRGPVFDKTDSIEIHTIIRNTAPGFEIVDAQPLKGSAVHSDSGICSELILKVPIKALDHHSFPPKPSVKLAPLPDDNIDPEVEPIEPSIPPHLAYKVKPSKLPCELRTRYRQPL